MSFLLGDAVARQAMGSMISRGYNWRQLFYFAASVAGAILVANLLFLRSTRTKAGHPEPVVNPLNVFHSVGEGSGEISFTGLLRPLLSNGNFLIVCFLSFGTTIVRETFNTWTPTYLHSHLQFISNAAAASTSAVFPAVGAVSVGLAGWAGDRMGLTGRSIVLFIGMALTTVALFVLTVLIRPGTMPHRLCCWEVLRSAYLDLIRTLPGAMALDFGGGRAVRHRPASSMELAILVVSLPETALPGYRCALAGAECSWRSRFSVQCRSALQAYCLYDSVAS